MPELREAHRRGLDYLGDITHLLQRVRLAHPTWGLFEAAEVQWWWAQTERPTDDADQLFWLDGGGLPAAAVIVTDFGGEAQLDPIVLPDARPDRRAHLFDRGLANAHRLGYDHASLEVDRDDAVLRTILSDRGFDIVDAGLVESWLAPDDRPPIAPLPDGYRLVDRTDPAARPHHMINARRNHVDPEPRLRETSLYRPDLDLAVYDADGAVAAYGLFWHDPITGVGVTEPMRTEEAHQGRGLARHVLTAGLDRLAAAGARRLKICFEPSNAASSHLYTSVGFVPGRANDLWSGPTS